MLAVVGLGVLLVAAGVQLGQRMLDHERSQAVAATEREALNLARAYEENVHQILLRLDQALTHLRDEHERDPKTFSHGMARYSPLYADLAFQFLVIDAAGRLAGGSSSTPPGADFSDREYFQAQRDSREDRLHVSKPLVGRISDRPTIQVTRRLRRPDGAFGGVLVLSVSPDKFAGFYDTAEIGPAGAVMLVGLDRVVRAQSSPRLVPRSVSLPAVGETLPERPFLDPAQPPAGVFHWTRPTDGQQRVVAYRRLADQPLVVTVALDEAQAMAAFEERRASVVQAGFIVSAVVLGTMTLVGWLAHLRARQQQRLMEAQFQMAQTDRRWRVALEAVGDGVWDWNLATGEVFYSAGWKGMLGFAEDEIPGRLDGWESRIHPEDREAVFADLDRHLRGETPFYANKHRIRCKDGRYKWILGRGVVVGWGADGAARRMVGTHTDIGELKTAEELLSATAARLTAILDSAPVGITIVDPDRRITVINAKMAQIIRREPDELLGTPTRVLYDSDEQFADIGRRLYPALNSGGTISEELLMRRGDGTAFWARIIGRRVSMDEPALGIVWVVEDISVRKAAEQALVVNTRFQRTLIDTIPIPIFVKDTQSRYLDANAAFECWTGVDRESLIGKSSDDLAPMELATIYREADRDLLASSHTQSFESRMRMADGTEREVEFSKAVFLDASGVPAGIVGAVIDISERKRAEQALHERQELFEQIFVANLAVKLLIDPADGRIIDANPAAAAFYGHTLDALKAMRITDINTLSPDEVRQEMERAQHEERMHFHFRHRVAGGAVRDVEVYSSPIMVNGHPLLLSLVHDITERRKVEEALERQTDELRRSNAELEAFAYVASHDLRQPLRTINSYLALLEKDLEGKLDEDCQEFIGFARGGALRMDRLIVDLLEYSRVGRKASPFKALPAAAVVETAVRNLEGAITDTAATITVEDGLPTLWGDENELVRLFQNIIGNAVKYHEEGRAPVVHVSCAAEAEGWHFRIRDNGIGIAPEHVDRVFGIFQRLHSYERYEGTGVGLAICKKIVERHGGRIWVESEPGSGSVFHLTLPRRTESDA